MKFSYKDNYMFWKGILLFPTKAPIYGCNMKEIARQIKLKESPK